MKNYYLQIIFIILLWMIKVRVVNCRASHILCGRIPGLSHAQQQLCIESPDALAALGAGHHLGAKECQHQFKGHRWNCSGVWQKDVFGHVMFVGSKEAAFTYAITSAGAVHAITTSCAKGNISLCGCDTILNKNNINSISYDYHNHQKNINYVDGSNSMHARHHHKLGLNNNQRQLPNVVNGQHIETNVFGEPWKWGGCSADINFGIKYARKFLDGREIEKDARALMNLHNNRVGRRIVKNLLRTECKCHGVSGSCAMQTCWKSLPPFRVIGDALMKKYDRAKLVHAIKDTKTSALILVLTKKGRVIKNVKKSQPKRMEFVYIESSPNYCEKNLLSGSFGTVGRKCNRTTRGIEGCDLLCCGRGYNTHQINKQWQCNCKFQWCCQVQCDVCRERYEEYSCK